MAARSRSKSKTSELAPPSHDALGKALRACYQDAGLRQVDVVERVQSLGIAGLPKDFVTQPKLSRWATGRDRPPLDVLPVIEAVCKRPTGSILHAAGYVGALVPTVPLAVEMDPQLSPEAKRMLLASYEALRGL